MHVLAGVHIQWAYGIVSQDSMEKWLAAILQGVELAC